MPTGSGLAAQLGAAEETITNEVQRLSGTPSGTFTLSYDGAVTAPLATNASSAAIVAALVALPNIGAGGVTATGGPLPTAVDITFVGPLVAGKDVPQLVVQTGITGLTASTVTPGKGYGDANTPNRFYEFEQEDFKLDIGQVKGGGIRAGNAYQRSDRRRQGLRQGGGGVSMEVHNKSFGFWLKQLFGKAAVITTPAGGTLLRDQTFTLGDGLNIGTMVQIGRPDVQGDAANVNPMSYRGAKVIEGEFTLETGGFLMCKLGFDLRDEEESTGLAVASYPASTKALDWQGSSVTIGGAPVDVQKVTLKIARKLNVGRFFHGSNLKRQPLLNDLFDVGMEIETEFIDPVLYRRYSQEGATLPQVIWNIDGDFVEALTGGNGNHGLQFTIPNAVTTGETPNVGNNDIVPLKLAMEATHDGTNELITGRYRSTDTSS